MLRSRSLDRFFIGSCACALLAACEVRASDADESQVAGVATATSEAAPAGAAEPLTLRSEQRKKVALRGLDYSSGVARVDAAAAALLVAGPDAELSAQAQAQAAALMETNRNWDAVEAATRGVLLAPDAVAPWQMLGDALLKKRLSQEAVAAFRAGLELEPASVGLRFGLADALMRADDRAAAIVELRAVLTASPEHAAARERLAAQLYYTGDPAAAWAEVHALEARGGKVPPQFRALLAQTLAEPR
jgi:tetratricopeptide (TPR) repeat protein